MIMFVTEHPWRDAHESRMFDKVLRTAGLDPDAALLADMEGGRRGLWEAIRASRPRVIVALGPAPSRLLLKAGGKFKLGPAIGTVARAPYLGDGVSVVPCYHPSYLLIRGISEIRQAVKILVAARRLSES